MKVQAKAKFIRISPRKTRLLVDLIRGMDINEARAQLKVSRKMAATPVLKCLNSAIANAQNNFNQDVSNYKVVEAYVDEGPTISRFRPRAHGRAAAIRKRMSHITIAVGNGVEEKVAVETPVKEEKKAAPKAKAVAKKPAAKKAKVAEKKDAPKKTSAKKSTK